MDSSLPVDIKLGSLLDWLQNRRHIKQDWAQKVKDIRAKIAAAIQDMPESQEIKDLLSNTYINYFHCVKIVEILKETEKDTQNFFGYYSSQRMKDWQAIISSYQKDKVYIAEAGHYLNQLVKYDIPGLKRELTGIEKKISEKEEREKNHVKLSGDCKKLYRDELARRELKGDNIRAELIQKTQFIPKHAQEIGSIVVSLRKATEMYLKYRQEAYGKVSPNTLHHLLFVQENGPLATVYQLNNGVAPVTVERPNYEHLCQTQDVENDDDDEIDFGDLDDGGYDISVEGGGEIDFGDTESSPELNIVADSNGPASTIAIGDEALTLIENKYTRQVCKEELTELLAFLKTRVANDEREHPADMMLHSYLKNDGNKLNFSTKEIKASISEIQTILKDFNDPDKAMLFEIFHSPSSMEALVDKLSAMKAKIGHHEKSAELVRNDQKDLREAFASKIADVKVVITKAKQLEGQLQKELKQFTQDRPVNFMGGVKSIDPLFSAYSI